MKFNILVTAGGSIVGEGIIKCLNLANKSIENSIKYKIISADKGILAPSLYRCDKGILIPAASSPDYIDSLMKIVKKENIDAIFTGSDEELYPLSEAKEEIEKETSTKVVVNPSKVISIARDKWRTFNFLKKNNLPCAESFLPEDQEKAIHEFGFPLIVKPREGAGSLHFYITRNKDELKYAIHSIQETGWRPLIQEYLNGDPFEFTTGVTVDRLGRYIISSVSIKSIRKKRTGTTYKAFIDDYKDIRKLSEEAALKVGARGAINIQTKFHHSDPKIFEINPRFSATTPMRAVAGINEPHVVFRNLVLTEDIKLDTYERIICLRYWNEIYVKYSSYDEIISRKSIENGESFIIEYF